MGNRKLKGIAIAIAIQEKIAQKVRTRREKARQLRSEAESQWEEAKAEI